MPPTDAGWRHVRRANSLPEVHGSIAVPAENASFWRKLWAFTGPGLMVAVGYMDPGNWATDIEGGARYGYLLLTVILISNFFAMLLQHLAVKLGIVTGRDLAQACRDHYSRPVSFVLWVLCEIAIAACDLAEVIGSAIAINLLFGIPLTWGVVLTILDVLVVLFFQSKGFRIIESIVAGLIALIFACFVYEIIASHPDYFALSAKGWCRSLQIVTDPHALYLAIGILGATVMPHNLYLHSSIVQTRAIRQDEPGKRMAIKFATIDSTVALLLAFFVNGAILVVSAASVPQQQPARRGRHLRRPQAAGPGAGRRRGLRGICRGPAGFGPELDPDGHAGRANRDGRLPRHPAQALGAPPHYPRHCRGAGPHRHHSLRRKGDE